MTNEISEKIRNLREITELYNMFEPSTIAGKLIRDESLLDIIHEISELLRKEK